MAAANSSAAPLPAHADPHPPRPHPMASPGYGKRATPGQHRRSAHDFAALPPREAAIAAYIDRLPDGADISVKTLAKELPYGQCALRTALNRIQEAGHLRRGREHLTTKSGTAQWITRTWFSRTARDDTWWARFTRGDVPEEEPDRARPTRSSTRSRAHILLAALGRTAPALSLSQADCAALAPLLTPWFERGATDESVRRTLTSGLPTPVHSPAALIRTRLRDKLPPEPVPTPEPAPAPPPLRMLECAHCRAPGRPEALTGGVCGACRGERAPAHPKAPLSAAAVHTHAAQIRAAMSQQPREGTPV
ncbi:DNA replication and repair protein RecO [Streptomyces sp. cf124]|nr:DNA replication and repair protein RecO [Streptomyces sp. cf124]